MPPDKDEYHLYRLPEDAQQQQSRDWQRDLDLKTATAIAKNQPSPLRFLVLYGSLRETSYSRLLAFEMARLLEVCVESATICNIGDLTITPQRMGAEVRVFNPGSLPVKHDYDPVPLAAQELRNLSLWSSVVRLLIALSGK
jgi:arsenic resistance protein ArsH